MQLNPKSFEEEIEHPHNWFWKELDEGLIHFRDRLQFELKSEFTLVSPESDNSYTQEFFFFIPESLQINSQTYSRDQFYIDQTNLIRFKTPVMSFSSMLDPHNHLSPLNRLQTFNDEGEILHEIQMLGNIFRSTLREEIKELILDFEKIHDHQLPARLENRILEVIENVKGIQKRTDELHKEGSQKLLEALNYLREFIQLTIDNFFTGFLDIFRKKDFTESKKCDEALIQLLIKEDKRISSEMKDEEVLLRSSMLNKYMYEALSLESSRVAVQKKHGVFFSALAAGIAMFFYMGFLAWKGVSYGINSLPFVLIAVFLYVIKDRLKESLKEFYFTNAYRWFPDYSTKIRNTLGETIGKVYESFTFIEQNQLPPEILKLRDEESPLLPPETIMQYKKEVILRGHLGRLPSRRNELSAIFRYNIHKLLEKANDSIQTRLMLNQENLKIIEKKLPKIYHLTILLRDTYKGENNLLKVEIKKFRVIFNKSGIERVQYLGTYSSP